MIEELLKKWDGAQKLRGPENAYQRAILEIEIAESLQREGYTGQLDGFSTLQEIIDQRREVVELMKNR